MENNIIKNIYKISHIIDGDVKYIFVFIGKTVIENRTESLEKLFLKNFKTPMMANFILYLTLYSTVFLLKKN